MALRPGRIAVVVILGLAGYFALFGGEYSVFELREVRTETAARTAELDSLRAELDSLRAWVDSLETDPSVLERLAREEHGMIRDGEVLYLVVPPDPGSASGDSLP